MFSLVAYVPTVMRSALAGILVPLDFILGPQDPEKNGKQSVSYFGFYLKRFLSDCFHIHNVN